MGCRVPQRTLFVNFTLRGIPDQVAIPVESHQYNVRCIHMCCTVCVSTPEQQKISPCPSKSYARPPTRDNSIGACMCAPVISVDRVSKSETVSTRSVNAMHM